MAKYSMIVSWSEDDNCYIVVVPDLPSCMADGKTSQVAVENAQAIISEWIETAELLGRDILKSLFNSKNFQRTKCENSPCPFSFFQQHSIFFQSFRGNISSVI